MKIVGIATRARITDYSLPYVAHTDSLVDTMAFFFPRLSFRDMFFFFFYFMYVSFPYSSFFCFYVHTYRYQIGRLNLHFKFLP